MRRAKSPQQLTWASALSGREVRVTAVGRGRALIENHAGIVEYSRERIVVSCPKGHIAVRGRELTLKEVRRDALIAAGQIDALEFFDDSAAR